MGVRVYLRSSLVVIGEAFHSVVVVLVVVEIAVGIYNTAPAWVSLDCD